MGRPLKRHLTHRFRGCPILVALEEVDEGQREPQELQQHGVQPKPFIGRHRTGRGDGDLVLLMTLRGLVPGKGRAGGRWVGGLAPANPHQNHTPPIS